jgi:hypothetical protein
MLPDRDEGRRNPKCDRPPSGATNPDLAMIGVNASVIPEIFLYKRSPADLELDGNWNPKYWPMELPIELDDTGS